MPNALQPRCWSATVAGARHLADAGHRDLAGRTAVLLAERVERGEFVAIAGDRVPIVAGRASAVQVPFLGHVAPFPTGAYMLASLLKCPLYSVACIRQGDTHESGVQLSAPRRARGCCRAAISWARLRGLRQRLRAAHRGPAGTRAPYEWFNFFSFWDQPGALAAPSSPAAPLTDSRSITFDFRQPAERSRTSAASRRLKADASSCPTTRPFARASAAARSSSIGCCARTASSTA